MTVEQMDMATLSGWLAALGVVLAWLLRAFSVVRRVGQFEAAVIARLDALDERQDRLSERTFQEFRDIQGRLDRHVDIERRPS